MSSELEYKLLIKTLYQTFPDYPKWLGDTKQIIHDNVSVNFSFFISYTNERWCESKFQEKVAHLIDAMSLSNDKDVIWVTNDFMLDFYLYFKEHDINLEPFLALLNPKTKSRLIKNYEFWIKANGALRI